MTTTTTTFDNNHDAHDFDEAALLPQEAPYLRNIETSLQTLATNSEQFMQWLQELHDGSYDQKALYKRLRKLGDAMTIFLKNVSANQEHRHILFGLQMQNVQDAFDGVMAFVRAHHDEN